jgi:hypothetical protein
MGEHWQAALSIPGIGDQVGLPVDLWVASAGYGLVNAGDSIKPYAATFAPGLPDSVVGMGEPNRPSRNGNWWGQLAQWPGPNPGNPRSVSELARQNPGNYLLVVLGSTYLSAVQDDVITARSLLKDPGLLLIISAGTSRSSRLGSNLIPVGSAHQQALGGTRVSLNARAARWLIATWPDHRFSAAAIASAVAGMRRQQVMRAKGKQMSDAEVSAFIRAQLEKQPSVRKTALLRQLRSQGQACEQDRFAGIFEQVARDR